MASVSKSIPCAEPELTNTTLRQVRWLSRRFGIPANRAQILVSYIFETTGRRS